MWGGENIEGSIAQSFSLTKYHYGLLSNGFLVAVALGKLFSGKLFNKVGTRVGCVISIGVWGHN